LRLSPGDIAITDVSVVPMSSAGVLEHRTVVVRGDRIVALVPSAPFEAPAGATTIDGSHKWLLPGLADMHVHTGGGDDLTLFLAAGVTTVRNMFGSALHLTLRSQIARGELQGPTIVTAGPLIDGDPPVWPGSTVLVNPADADRIVAEQKAQGYDFLKPYSRLSREAYEALAAAGKRHGMALAGHVPDTVGLAGALAANQKSIEHLDGWLLAMVPEGVTLPREGGQHTKLRGLMSKLDASKLPGLIAQTIAAGTWNCPSLIVYERFGALEDLPGLKQRAKWLAMVPPAVVAQWDPKQDFRTQGLTAETFATLREANAWRGKVLAALSAADAPIIVGTDTGNPFVIPGESLHDEIELMVAAGMPRAKVLRAATAAAAEYLGTPHEFGVVEVGARADLVLAATNPLTDPLPLVPEGVMVRGRWLARAELETRLAEIAKRNAAPAAISWDGVPALVATGKELRRASYAMAMRGRPTGEERVAIGALGAGKRAIVGQAVADYGARIETSYTILPDATTVAVKSPFGAYALSGKFTAGTLVVTGNDAAGKPVALRAPLAAGAFLSGPGIGGAIAVADRLTGMKVGDKRTLRSLEITYYPKVEITAAEHDVERKPDASGRRVFAVTTRSRAQVTTGTLELDDSGVSSYTLTAPLDVVFTRLRG
jgi:imidazolonepropionase-like amidohydrolase